MYIADLHIHSRYSRATSRDCTPEHLDLWARKKGIHILGTGDFTHPAWRGELAEKLQPAEEGLYVLKQEFLIKDPGTSEGFRPRFVLQAEISSIYKRHDKVRKVHNVILLPGLEEAGRLAKKLEEIGNIHSDGRPILGIDCRDLLEITLEICPRAIFVPAHIWTPHFSLFGAFSGFQRVEECFGDMTPYIHAMETGLSSDPPMNWRISALDAYQLISNSDAHSPSKLGREANLLDIDLSYQGIYDAIQGGQGLLGTIEFFPEEGKYHFDGHRKCNISLSPAQTRAYGGICPVCGKKLTIGVSHRVEELADRPEGFALSEGRPFESLVPLLEVIAASTGYTAASKKVQSWYQAMLSKLGAEFPILREVSLEDIRKVAGSRIADGIGRIRGKQVKRIPGFDGAYGRIEIFSLSERAAPEGQLSLFSREELAAYQERFQGKKEELEKTGGSQGMLLSGETAESFQDVSVQRKAGNFEEGTASVLSNVFALKNTGRLKGGTASDLHDTPVPGAAGRQEGENGSVLRDTFVPALAGSLDGGTTLCLNAMQEQAARTPARAMAVIAGPGTGKTRTLVERIACLVGERQAGPGEITAVTFTQKAAKEMRERLKAKTGRGASRIQIGTFHGICHRILMEEQPGWRVAGEMETWELAGEVISRFGLDLGPKQFLEKISRIKTGLEQGEEVGENALQAWQSLLEHHHLLDYDDLLIRTLELFERGDLPKKRRKPFTYLLVDEFQDISPIQYQLVQAWNREGRELFVIGDANQTIYGFRGSDPRCFERLRETFPQLHSCCLEENYRSSPEILSAAQAVIAHNGASPQNIRPTCQNAGPVRLVEAHGERQAAIFVAKEISRLVGGMDMLNAQDQAVAEPRAARGFGEIAVLYRTHRQAALLEECLKTEGIPYVVAGREDFLTTPLVRGTISFFRWLLRGEEELLLRVCLSCLWPGKQEEAKQRLLELAEKYRPRAAGAKPARLLEEWAKDLSLAETEEMQKLVDIARMHKKMEEFLETLLLGQEIDLKRCGQKSYSADSVTLMTLHASKGLEFPVVFIAGLNDGLLPMRYRGGEENTEEERRLFYVGMTRAGEELILLCGGKPSPFLEELPQDGILQKITLGRKTERQPEQLSLFGKGGLDG